MYSSVLFWILYPKHMTRSDSLNRKTNIVDSYTEASVPTPADQQDASPLDLVSDAVEEIVDNVSGVVTSNDERNQSKGK